MNATTAAATRQRVPYRTSRRAAIGAAALVLLGVLASVFFFPLATANGEEFVLGEAVLIMTAYSAFALVGGLVASRVPSNSIGWLMLAVGVGAMVMNASQQYATYGLRTEPGTVPGALAVAWLSNWGFYATLTPALFLLLLFPSGRPASKAWRVVLGIGIVFVALVLSSLAFGPRRLEVADVANPLRVDALSGVLGGVDRSAGFLLLFVLVSCVAAPFARWRSSRGVERQQIKWLALGAAVFAMCFGVIAPASDVVLNVDVGTVAWAVGLVALPIAIGVGILGYRLFDFDRVINRSLVYLTLSACLLGLYAGVVTVFAEILGETEGALLATGAVAVTFQPLRGKLQRAVNRMTFGRRDEPYEVIRNLAGRLETSLASQEALATVTQAVIESLRLPYAAIALSHSDGFTVAAESGDARSADLELPLLHRGEEVGRLLVAARSEGEVFSSADLRLLEDLAHQASAAAYATRLFDELQRSRERLVSALEEERRRIRRDLHDGLGPSLAAMSLELEAAGNLVKGDPDAASTLLESMVAEMQSAISDIRRLVYGLRPPALDELGVVGALREQARHFESEGRLRVSVRTEGEPRELSAATEVAIYRIAVEAMTNSVKHSQGTRCDVLVRYGNHVAIEIRDDGKGVSPHDRPGVGLTSMRERADELGGPFSVAPIPGGGTVVAASLPAGTA